MALHGGLAPLLRAAADRAVGEHGEAAIIKQRGSDDADFVLTAGRIDPDGHLLGNSGDAEFAPAARLARKLKEDLAIGIEYYSALGPVGNFLPLTEQQHNIYGVVDFKIGQFDVNFGVGYGLTSGSDRWMTKLIIGTDLNDPNVTASKRK